MIKGKTTIILTDVNTGKQKVHEDENLITHAIDKIINIEMAVNHAPNTRLLPFATQALGGLMLFDDELDEDEDNIHFPSDVHLVGYAGQNLNTSDKYRGSYNAIESGKTVDGYISVWDFGTEQANGTIRSLARTHAHAGQNPIFNRNGPDYSTTLSGNPSTDANWYPIRYDGEYLYMLKGNTNTHVMRLARVKIPMMAMGAGDYSDVERTYEVVASWNTEVTTYSYNDSRGNPAGERTCFADDPLDYEDGHDGYIYCMFYGANQSYNTYEYDITYFTINYGDESYDKSSTVRLRSGTSYWTSEYENYMYRARRICGHVHKGILYRIANNRKIIFKIPLRNVASYSAVRIISDDDQDYIANLYRTCAHEGMIYFQIYHYTQTSNQYWDGILYPDGVFILPQGYGTANINHGGANPYIYEYTVDDDLTSWGNYDSTRVGRNWTANYLGTINNLASAVVKTAAQTMKVIYTLTDVDDSEEEEENNENAEE